MVRFYAVNVIFDRGVEWEISIRYPSTLNPYFCFLPLFRGVKKTTRVGNIFMDSLYPINCVVGMERWFYVKNITYKKNDFTIYIHPDMGYLPHGRVK